MKHYKNGSRTSVKPFPFATLLLILCILLPACSGSRIVQPLNKSDWQVSANFGGPLISNDNKTEITPLSSITGAYGFRQNITGFASWQWGSFLYDNYHFDFGYTHEILQPFSIQPGITYTVQANIIYKEAFSNFKLYPQVDINAYWILPNKDFIYTGFSNWFELSQTKAHGVNQENFWIPNLHAGYTKFLDKYSAGIEIKYIAPFETESKNLVEFVNIGDKGAIGVYFSLARNF